MKVQDISCTVIVCPTFAMVAEVEVVGVSMVLGIVPGVCDELFVITADGVVVCCANVITNAQRPQLSNTTPPTIARVIQSHVRDFLGCCGSMKFCTGCPLYCGGGGGGWFHCGC